MQIRGLLIDEEKEAKRKFNNNNCAYAKSFGTPQTHYLLLE